MNSGRDDDDQILLKRSGKRGRLEITVDDLESPTTRLPAVSGPGPSTGRSELESPRRAEPEVQLRTPRPLPGRGGRPPAGGPPDRYVHDVPTPWWRTRAATWAAAGLLALAVVAVVLVVALTGGKSSEEVAYGELKATHTTVVNVMDEASQAKTLVDLRAAGVSAGGALDSLQAPEAELRQVGDESVRQPSLDLVAAERLYLQALQRLSGVDRAFVAERSSARWSSIRQGLENRERQLVTAGGAVAALRLGGAPDKIVLSDADLSGTRQAVDGTVTKARDALAAYRRELADWRRAVGRARGKERTINAYRSQVQGAIDAYAADRRKVDAFVERAPRIQTSDEVVRAADELSGFYSDRQRTIEQLSIALPNAPESVRAAHKNLQAPLQESLRGLSALQDALSEYQTDPYDTVYMSVTDTPGWQEFKSASDSATSQLGSATAQWGTAVQAAIKDVKDRGGIPPRPKPPSI